MTVTITVTPTKPGTVSDNAKVTATNVTDSPDSDDTFTAPVTVRTRRLWYPPARACSG